MSSGCHDLLRKVKRTTWRSFQRRKLRGVIIPKWWSRISSLETTRQLSPLAIAAYSQYQSSLCLAGDEKSTPRSRHRLSSSSWTVSSRAASVCETCSTSSTRVERAQTARSTASTCSYEKDVALEALTSLACPKKPMLAPSSTYSKGPCSSTHAPKRENSSPLARLPARRGMTARSSARAAAEMCTARSGTPVAEQRPSASLTVHRSARHRPPAEEEAAAAEVVAASASALLLAGAGAGSPGAAAASAGGGGGGGGGGAVAGSNAAWSCAIWAALSGGFSSASQRSMSSRRLAGVAAVAAASASPSLGAAAAAAGAAAGAGAASASAAGGGGGSRSCAAWRRTSETNSGEVGERLCARSRSHDAIASASSPTSHAASSSGEIDRSLSLRPAVTIASMVADACVSSPWRQSSRTIPDQLASSSATPARRACSKTRRDSSSIGGVALPKTCTSRDAIGLSTTTPAAHISSKTTFASRGSLSRAQLVSRAMNGLRCRFASALAAAAAFFASASASDPSPPPSTSRERFAGGSPSAPGAASVLELAPCAASRLVAAEGSCSSTVRAGPSPVELCTRPRRSANWWAHARR